MSSRERNKVKDLMREWASNRGSYARGLPEGCLLENAPGFHFYRDKLKKFRLDMEKEWAAEEDARAAEEMRLENERHALGIPDNLGTLLAEMRGEIRSLTERVYSLEEEVRAARASGPGVRV